MHNYELFIKAVNTPTTEKGKIATNFYAFKGQFLDMRELETEQSQPQEELIQQYINENAGLPLTKPNIRKNMTG